MSAITADFIADHNRTRLADHREDFEALARKLARRGLDPEALVRGRDGLRRRRAELGRRHGRHALRPLSRSRRAAQRLRQARRLRRDQHVDPPHADRLAAFSLGQGQGLCGAARGGEEPRSGVRRRQLQHLPGPGGPAAVVQVRLAHPHRQGGARAGDRPQYRVRRDRPRAGLEGADGVDRRRLELRRPVEPGARVRPLSRLDRGDLSRAARRLAHAARAQAVRAGLLFDGDFRLGQQLSRRPAPRAEGPVPGRPRPSRADRQYRADRRPPRPLRQARRLPLQRQQVRRRRPRRRLGLAVPALSGVPRTGRGERARSGRASRRLT